MTRRPSRKAPSVPTALDGYDVVLGDLVALLEEARRAAARALPDEKTLAAEVRKARLLVEKR